MTILPRNVDPTQVIQSVVDNADRDPDYLTDVHYNHIDQARMLLAVGYRMIRSDGVVVGWGHRDSAGRVFAYGSERLARAAAVLTGGSVVSLIVKER